MRKGVLVLGGVAGALLALAGCDSGGDASATVAATDGGFPAVDGAVPGVDAALGDSALAPAADAGDAALAAPLALTASNVNVATTDPVILTVAVNGGVATSVEIDEGNTAVATFTAAPYTKSLAFTFLENGTHSYTAKATLAGGQVVTSAPVVVTVILPANGFFVDPANGLDTSSGLQSAPFKTIDKAVSSLTTDGQTIYLAPGTYDKTNQTNMHFTLPHVTNVRGLGQGVVLAGIPSQGNGNGFTFAVGGDIRDLAIHTQYGGIFVQGGTFHAGNVAMDAVDDAYYFRGNTVATVDAGPITNTPGAALGAAVTTDEAAVATWNGAGGTFDLGGKVINALFVRGHSTLTVNDFTVTNCRGHALVLYDNGHVTLNDTTITGSGLDSSGSDASVIAMGGQNTEAPVNETLTINGGSISNNPENAIVLSLYGTTPETPVITLKDTHVDSNAYDGLLVAGTVTNAALTVTLSATNTTFSSNKGTGILAPRAALSVTGGAVSGNGADGIQLSDAASVNTLKVRGTTLSGNVHNAIEFNGTAASVLDLGKAGDPGGLTFAQVPASYAAVNLEAILAGSAIGNTWVSSQQGADASGKYTTATTLNASGVNAKLAAGATLIVE